MSEETTIVNTNGYTIQQVLDNKEHIPVNEDNIMDLTSAYIDEDELKVALVPYTTKTLLYSEIDPLETRMNNLEIDLSDRPTYSWVLQNLPELDLSAVTYINGFNLEANPKGGNDYVQPRIATVKSNGIMEIGRYLDFHDMSKAGSTSTDFDVRLGGSSGVLEVNAGNGGIKVSTINGFTVPSDTATIPSAVSTPVLVTITNDWRTNIGKSLRFYYSGKDYYLDFDSKNNLLSATGGISIGKITAGDISCENINSTGDITAGDIYVNRVNCSSLGTSGDIISSDGNIMCPYLFASNIECNEINGYYIYGDPSNTSTSKYQQPCIPAIKSDGVMEVGKYIDFHDMNKSGSTYTDYDVRLQCDGKILKLNGNGGTKNLNNTITHNAPVNEPIEAFQLGTPIFSTGIIHYYDSETHTYIAGTNGYTNCIPSVKTIGSYKQYLGICTEIHPAGSTLLFGDGVKVEVKIDQPTITFASHGDFLFRVNDSSQYEVGDVVLFDGNKLDEDLMITTKIQLSIVGKVTAIVDKHLLSVFNV